LEQGKGHEQTILIVDDEIDMLSLLDRILTEADYHVLKASDGAYGLTLMEENEPDLVLLDVLMAGPDGFATLGRIRQISDVPVIMLTAVRDTDSMQKTFDLGADDFIRKPFRPAELVARIQAKLKRSG